MAGEEHACGPEADPELFAELEAVFDRFPGQSEKYIITCVDHETEIMGIDFATQEGHKRIEGDTIVTTFHPRTEQSDKVIYRMAAAAELWLEKRTLLVSLDQAPIGAARALCPCQSEG